MASFCRPVLTVLACVLASVALLTGCEEDVTAALGSDRAYSMYGVFTPELDTQWIRVYPIEDRLEPIEAEPLDVRFTSTDLETGEEIVWNDSLLQEPDGQYAHVFWAPFRAEYGHTYRARVEGADGEASQSTAEVPPEGELILRDPGISPGSVTLPVFVSAEVPRLNKIEVEYFIKYDEGPQNLTTVRVRRAYEQEPQRTEGGWLVRIDLDEAHQFFRDNLILAEEYNPAYGVVLLNMTLRMVAANEAWNPPGGSFDPEVLVQPGTMSNVENGFGFVGAGYRLEHEWTPPDSALDAAGFALLRGEEEE